MITLFRNGNIRTMEKGMPRADSMVVEGNRFTYVGTEEGAREFVKGQQIAVEKEVDLRQAFVIPGLNDSHMHFIHFAKSMKSINLAGAKSIAELKERIRAGVQKRSEEDLSWLEGEGWNQDFFQDEKRFPNKFDLDEITGDIPVLVMRACFHIGVLNTAAMKAIGLNKETAPQYGDLVELLPDGEPNGVIKENFLNDLKIQISTLDLNSLKEIILAAQEKLLEQGLTSVQSDDVGYLSGSDYDLLFQAFDELEQEGRLRMRIGQQCLLEKVPQLEEFFQKGYGISWGSEKSNVTSIKLLLDGSLGARTAALRVPYADDPKTKGLLLMSQEMLDELVLLSHKNQCPTAIHAIGDKAIEMALDAIEKARKTGGKNIRHGIVHCQITDENLLERFRQLDVLALIQPIFIDYDMHIVRDRVGSALTDTSYAWKTMIQKGVHTSLGTDCPVEAFDTMPNLYSAVARKNLTGEKKEAFLPEEKLTMAEALYAYTVEGAYASGEEDLKGSIAAGKLADFVLLNQDLFSLKSEEDILKTKVMATYFDGALAYCRE